MLSSDFATIDFIDRTDYLPFWKSTQQRAADYTFTNLWGWSGYHCLEWRLAYNLCWIRQSTLVDENEIEEYWAPIGDWESADWQAIPWLKDGFVLNRVPEQLCTILQERFQDRVHIEETRGQWEYLYKQSDLATLSGRRLHKKKNHFNAYCKAYGEDYRQITLENVATVLHLQHDWCEWRGCKNSPSLAAEGAVIGNVLKRWKDLPELVGGALYVQDKMIAFSIGEGLDENNMVVHFEKALPNFNGIYQAMNACFAKNAGAPYAILNREQDLDEDGLRQAKESYYPIDFLKKNRVHFL